MFFVSSAAAPWGAGGPVGSRNQRERVRCVSCCCVRCSSPLVVSCKRPMEAGEEPLAVLPPRRALGRGGFFLFSVVSESDVLFFFWRAAENFGQDSLLSGADGKGVGMVVEGGGDVGGGGGGGGGGSGGDDGAQGGYRHGVFVRAARGSSIDVGLFHDDQRRSVTTLEVWVNAGEKV